jgi:hypothetical protein
MPQAIARARDGKGVFGRAAFDVAGGAPARGLLSERALGALTG